MNGNVHMNIMNGNVHMKMENITLSGLFIYTSLNKISQVWPIGNLFSVTKPPQSNATHKIAAYSLYSLQHVSAQLCHLQGVLTTNFKTC
jgi:hypothetical protein